MGFELNIPETSGIPDGSLISIKVGNVRRQAFFGSNYEKKPFKFPETNGKYEPMKVDIFYPIAQARLLLDVDSECLSVPLYTMQGELATSLPKLDGDEAGGLPLMSMDLKMAKGNSCARKDKDSVDKNEQIQESQEVDRNTAYSPGSSARRHKTALESQQYMQDHWLLETFQALLQTIIVDRPSDPYAYMTQYLQQPMSQRLQSQRSVSETPKLGEGHREVPPLFASGYPTAPRESAQQAPSEAIPEDWTEKRRLIQNAMVDSSWSGDLTRILCTYFGEQTEEDQQREGHVQVLSARSEREDGYAARGIVVEQIAHPLRPDDNFPAGKFFYCSADQWSELVGLSSPTLWNGRQYDISQKRNGIEIWAGAVVLNHSGHLGCYGYRVSTPTGGQFQIGDVLTVNRSSRARLLKPRPSPARETISGYGTDVRTDSGKCFPSPYAHPQTCMKVENSAAENKQDLRRRLSQKMRERTKDGSLKDIVENIAGKDRGTVVSIARKDAGIQPRTNSCPAVDIVCEILRDGEETIAAITSVTKDSMAQLQAELRETAKGCGHLEVAAKPSKLGPGAKKVIIGMQTDPELNGMTCSIIQRGEDAGQWLVNLGGCRTALCADENLMEPECEAVRPLYFLTTT